MQGDIKKFLARKLPIKSNNYEKDTVITIKDNL